MPVVSKTWSHPGTQDEELGVTDFYYSFDYRNYLDKLSDYRFDRDGAYHLVGVTQRFNVVQAEQMWPGYYRAGQGNQRRDGNDHQRWLSLRVGYAYRKPGPVGYVINTADLVLYHMRCKIRLPSGPE